MLQQRYDASPHWLQEDHPLDLPDDIGFEKETIEKFDLFTHKPFQLPNFRGEQIKQLAISPQMFLIITRANNIFRWRAELEDACQQLELPEAQQGYRGLVVGAILQRQKQSKDINLDRIFLSGYHAIISSDSGENFYINYRDSKIKPLEQLRGKVVKAIAWSEVSDQNDTNEILIATKDSKILLYRIDLRQGDMKEAEAKCVVTIPNERQINQIEQFTMVFDKDKYACVVASTNFSVFFFFGANSLEILFGKYQDAQAVMRAESAPDRSYTSFLQVCYSKGSKRRATSFLYTNGRSLNLYQLPEKDLNEQILTSFKPLKTGLSGSEMPVQIGLTEFHYFILTSDSLLIYSRITQLEVQKYELRQMGRLMGMMYDSENEAFWIYSEKQVCKVEVSNEDKDAWKLLMDQKMYTEAFEIGKKYNSPYTQYIAGLCGDQLFNKQKYEEAASYYEKSSWNFEQIFLKYLSCDDMKARIGLEKYLKHLLESLRGESQRTIVLSWLVELLVYRLNETDKMTLESRSYESDAQRDKDIKDKKRRQKELQDEFDAFLKQYQQELPQDLVYQVMVSHGRLANCVDYAKLNNNFEMIIQHHINEENYKETIKNLKSVKDKSSLEVIQKYSYILMKHEPEETLKLLTTHIKKFDSTKIIGGLMNIPVEKRNHGIAFLEHSINQLQCAEKSIHNLLIFFLTQPPQKDKLNDYLQQQEELLQEKEKVFFDLDFALRLFKQASLIDAQITIYGMMGLFTESVTLALDYEMIEKAKEYASKPLDDEKKKKLWMMIAERLLQQNQSIEKVIELTRQAEMIKIEDLLPHFNENIKIEHFKDEICNSLRKYNEEIEKLKEEMKKLSQNSDQLKNELKMTKNKFLIIDTQQKCEHCAKHLFNDTFYIFPCNHGFHKDCIVAKLRSLPQHSGKLTQIENYDMTMQSILMKSNPTQKKQQQGDSFFQLMNLFGNKQEQRPQTTLTPEEEKVLRETKEKFDILVASECVFCGPSVVDSISIGFELDSDEKASWQL